MPLNLTSFKKGHSGYGKGVPRTEEVKRKIGSANAIALKGKKLNTNQLEALKLGRVAGRHWKIEDTSKMGHKRDKNPNWQGGKSYEPYSVDWTRTLKISIRERDKYVCQMCTEPQGDEALSVHHIDYDKKNCNPTNLIALCRKCHLKTNINRGYLIKYFYEKNL